MEISIKLLSLCFSYNSWLKGIFYIESMNKYHLFYFSVFSFESNFINIFYELIEFLLNFSSIPDLCLNNLTLNLGLNCCHLQPFSTQLHLCLLSAKLQRLRRPLRIRSVAQTVAANSRAAARHAVAVRRLK